MSGGIFGGLGGLGGLPFFQNDAAGGAPWKDTMQAIGLSLMSSPRNNPLQNLATIAPQIQQASEKRKKDQESQAGLKEALKTFGVSDPQAEMMAKSPEAGRLYLEKLQQDRQQRQFEMSYGLDSRRVALAEATAKNPELTPEIKNFAFLQKNPEFAPFFQMSKAPQTVINNGGANKYDDTVGAKYGETFINLQDAGRKAPMSIGNLNQMEELMQTPGFYTGNNAELNLKFKKALVPFGGDPNAPSAMENFRAIANRNIYDSLGSLGTGVSNGDREFITSGSVSFDNTPDGNRRLIQTQKAVEQRKMQVAELARQYVKKNGRLDAGFDAFLADWAEQNPLFQRDASGGLGIGGSRDLGGGVTVRRVR